MAFFYLLPKPRISYFLFLFLICFGCSSKKRDVYNESDYTLVKVDSLDGKVGTEYYVYNYDSSRRLQIEHWAGGGLLGKGFTNHGRIDGWFSMYDYRGKLIALDSFSNGKKILSRITQHNDTLIPIFKNGNLDSVKSIDSLLK